MSVDLVNNLLEQINKVDATRRAFLHYLQVENQCKCILGSPCHSHKCGCAVEMQDYIDKASAPPPAHCATDSRAVGGGE